MGVLGQLKFLLFGFLPDQFSSKLPVTHVDLTGRSFVVTGSNTGLGLATRNPPCSHEASAPHSGCPRSQKGNGGQGPSHRRKNGIAGTAPKFGAGYGRFWSMKRFQVNMLATGLLGVLLLPLLKKTSQLPLPYPDAHELSPHLTITGSGAQFLALFPEKKTPEILKALNDESKSIKRDRYPTSKLLLILFARSLAKLPSAEGCVADPGLCSLFDASLGPLQRVPQPCNYPVESSDDGFRVQDKVWDEMWTLGAGISSDVENIAKP
ncbi:hypothetical protein B0H14DRAFT_3157852 [Mycena olivaceomarginata]|nr:hypothetical protein B0H14DRAFT_3157852 [Mycena olivaceomarginata]